MKTRRLGRTDLELTRIGLGTWAIGGTGTTFSWGHQEDADSLATIREALDLGINWIDTAAAYGLGHSEEIVGKALKGRRGSVILATKCGVVWNPGESTVFNRLTAASVRAELEASLRRLGTDRIDLYQIHWPKPDGEIEEGWEEIARAVKAGKVRHAGVSNFSVSQMDRARAIHPIASLQPPYSMLRREVETEVLPYCAAHGIGVVAYSPLQTGILTGKLTRERAARLPTDDWRRNSSFLTEPALTLNLELVEKLSALAARAGRSVGELAIAWVLRRAELTSAIVGGRRSGQLSELASGADWDLPAEVIADVHRLLAERDAKDRE
jgi:aryl-alcohol dehydrogenase-like predicted oxidoreductase